MAEKEKKKKKPKEDEPANIFAAAEKGDVEAVDEALRMGVEIDTRLPESGATPLIAAAVAQHLNVVQHLLERWGAVQTKTTRLFISFVPLALLHRKSRRRRAALH